MLTFAKFFWRFGVRQEMVEDIRAYPKFAFGRRRATCEPTDSKGGAPEDANGGRHGDGPAGADRQRASN